LFRDPLRDPRSIGRGDLDPLFTERGGCGGMVFDPFRSRDPQNIGGIYGPGGPAGLPPYVVVVVAVVIVESSSRFV